MCNDKIVIGHASDQPLLIYINSMKIYQYLLLIINKLNLQFYIKINSTTRISIIIIMFICVYKITL